MADMIDAALELLHHTGPEYGGGLSNHGPMAAEAMLAMGRPEAILPWVERYQHRLSEHPTPSTPIAHAQWREVLGDRARLADWITFFDHKLADASWPEVVHHWVPHLSPGLMAVGTQRLIQTGHAVRALARGETPQRRHELAEGLGYWSAGYQPLPGHPSGTDRGWGSRQPLAHVCRPHDPMFRAQGVIHEAVQGLEADPAFAPVIDLIRPDGDLSRFLSELTELSASLYLAQTNDLIAFVHAVSVPNALRLLLPYLAEADVRLAARDAWYATTSPPFPTTFEPPGESREILIDRPMAAGGAHTIKLTEACLRKYAIHPHPVYLVAARDSAERVEGDRAPAETRTWS
jgi:hypothetical protein